MELANDYTMHLAVLIDHADYVRTLQNGIFAEIVRLLLLLLGSADSHFLKSTLMAATKKNFHLLFQLVSISTFAAPCSHLITFPFEFVVDSNTNTADVFSFIKTKKMAGRILDTLLRIFFCLFMQSVKILVLNHVHYRTATIS